ncbi:hypothetical protein VZ95_03065 [Elstera litoralis]|uniref:Uncharacterized protein n=1 Tax=Elstera litoralis TaxID=552518 RepID=A0A0F3IVZ7_9PROT|nr:hypothetical protein [Elstera litoralis]KJV10713.1 hypothetical protein VZ95_03065 [Elstera litoralis]
MTLWHLLGLFILNVFFYGLLIEMKGPSTAQMVQETIRVNPDTLQERCSEAECTLAFRNGVFQAFIR